MGRSGRRGREAAATEKNVSEGIRTLRLQELICEEVNFLLRSEVSDPRLQGVKVTFVELASDRSCARLWFTVENGEDEDEDNDDGDRSEALDRAGGFLRNSLAESLGLKRTPELRFRRDPATRSLAPAQEMK
jgi:ribosome-binding factor A